jgi:23S rRNA pseudouridine2605 synthase
MTDDSEVNAEPMRVQKFLSRAGHCSRREGEALMKQGRVDVNGEVCREMGSKVVPGEDVVEVDGRRVVLPDEFTHVFVNKPVGHVTTLDDPRGRPTVEDLLPDEMPRLWPVGRLDQDSSGLLLMTNDGELTHRLTHPSFEARKRYRVELAEEPDDSVLGNWRRGIELEDGYVTVPAEVKVVDRSGSGAVLEVTLTEGKNRQIRRMAEATGNEVESLERIGVGPLEIGGLEAGEWRELSDEEVGELEEEVDLER